MKRVLEYFEFWLEVNEFTFFNSVRLQDVSGSNNCYKSYNITGTNFIVDLNKSWIDLYDNGVLLDITKESHYFYEFAIPQAHNGNIYSVRYRLGPYDICRTDIIISKYGCFGTGKTLPEAKQKIAKKLLS